MSDINVEELCLVYKQIKSDPDSWNQGQWATKLYRWETVPLEMMGTECGTAYCFAGHVVVRSGATILWTGSSSEMCMTAYGEARSINSYAQQVLGLDHEQAADLFASDNSLAMLRSEIIGMTGVDPDM